MNFCGWDWGCYASWLNSPTGAAWAQAAGTIIAIYFAGAFARRQHLVDILKESAQKEQELIDGASRVHLYLERVCVLLNGYRTACEQAKGFAPVKIGGSYLLIVESLKQLDVNRLPPEVGFQLLRSLDALQALQPYFEGNTSPGPQWSLVLSTINEKLPVVELAKGKLEEFKNHWEVQKSWKLARAAIVYIPCWQRFSKRGRDLYRKARGDY